MDIHSICFARSLHPSFCAFDEYDKSSSALAVALGTGTDIGMV